jgi:uncharacterized protein (TIGR02266 family)
MGEAARRIDDHAKADARRSPRACVYVSIDVFSEHNFWTGLTMNMSEGGVFVATHHTAPVGTTLVVNMMLPFETQAIVTLAEVRWVRDYTGQDDVPPGLGLQFVDLDESSLAKIRKFVTTVREPLYFDE